MPKRKPSSISIKTIDKELRQPTEAIRIKRPVGKSCEVLLIFSMNAIKGPPNTLETISA